MRTSLLALNWILVVLVLTSAVRVASDGNDVTEVFFSFLGGCLWLFLPFLTLRAARRAAGKAVRAAAYIANAIPLIGCTLAFLFLAGESGLSVALVPLLFSAPFGFNVFALKHLSEAQAARRIESAQAEFAVSHPCAPAEPLPEPPSSAGTLRGSSPLRSTDARRSKSNYIARHWNGDLSLPVSYWVNGVLVGAVAGVLLVFVRDVIETLPLRAMAGITASAQLLAIAVTLWSSVGIWRSASNHTSRGGSRGWAVTAQVLTAFGLLSFAGTLTTTLLPQLKELTLIALDLDPMGPVDAKISMDGRSLVLQGTLGTGSTERVRRLLEAAPGIRAVTLQSPGGRLKEGEDIAALVREYGLDTYVESHCESACTYVFLAGSHRAAAPNARIGFHRPSFVGDDKLLEAEMLNRMQAVYRDAGISQRFLNKIAATPADSMWYPTRDELVLNGVINRASVGVETSTAHADERYTSKANLVNALRETPIMAALERHFPGTIDQAAEASWRAYTSGAGDADAMTAARKVIAEHVPQILMSASDEQLRAYVMLAVDQLRAAQAISDEACKKLIDVELDPVKNLPAELVMREMEVLLHILQGPLVQRMPVSDSEFEAVILPVLASLPIEYLNVLADSPSYQHEPGLICEATIALYEQVLALPGREQSIALTGLMQAAML